MEFYKVEVTKKKKTRRKYYRKFMFFLFYKIINQFNCFFSTFIRCILFFFIIFILLTIREVLYFLCVLPIDLWGEFILFEFNEISIENLLQLLFTIFLGFSLILLLLFASGFVEIMYVCVCIVLLLNNFKSYFLNSIFIEVFQFRVLINGRKIASQNKPLCCM